MNRPALAAVAALTLLVATAAGGEIVDLSPGDSVIVEHDGLAFLVHAPPDGTTPMVVAVFRVSPTPVPPIPPTPGTAAGVLIIEEQTARTVAQARVMDDPVWQAAALVKGLTYSIQDDDHEKAKAALPAIAKAALGVPVVCLIDSEGVVIEVRAFPETVDEIRALIGGLK